MQRDVMGWFKLRGRKQRKGVSLVTQQREKYEKLRLTAAKSGTKLCFCFIVCRAFLFCFLFSRLSLSPSLYISLFLSSMHSEFTSIESHPSQIGLILLNNCFARHMRHILSNNRLKDWCAETKTHVVKIISHPIAQNVFIFPLNAIAFLFVAPDKISPTSVGGFHQNTEYFSKECTHPLH